MKKIIFLLFGLLSMYQLNGQSKLDRAITNLSENYTQEKIYLLYDKKEYIAGEQITFKAFVFDGYQPSVLSTTLFVELYDRNKKIVDKKMLALNKGTTEGSFTLKDDLKEDIYFIRAYTPWIANFPSEFEYLNPVAVYNSTSTMKLTPEKSSKWTIKAVPESGNLVANLDSKVAVRLISEGNPPNKWSGYLINSEKPNEKIVSFNNLDENIAVLNFKPQEGIKYQIIAEDQSGNKQTSDLPEVKKSGTILRITNTDEGIKYTLSSAGLPNGVQNYKIVGTINNQMAYKANIKNNAKEASSIIPLKINNGNNGVLQVAIFDENDLFIGSRLVFINSKNYNLHQPEIKNLSLNTQQRVENNFDLAANSEFSNFAVIIKDNAEAQNQNSNKNNILSGLWLSEDFKTNIYSPAQYFTKTGNKEALDALLISEKWGRFNWENVLKGQAPQIKYKPEQYLAFKAKLAINSRQLPYTALNLVTSTREGDSDVAQFDTDDVGEFLLDKLNFNEPITITYFLNALPKGGTPSNLTLYLKPLVEAVAFTGNLPYIPYTLVEGKSTVAASTSITKAITSQKNKIALNKNEALIEEVKIKAQKVDLKEKLNRELSSGMFSSLNSTIFDFVNENQNASSSTNIMQWLQGRVAGLQIKMENGESVPYIRNSEAKIYLDEVPSDANMISSVSISDIAMVKVLKGGGLVGNAVAIYTRKGNMKSANDAPKDPSKNNKITLFGYNKPTPIDQPDYSNSAYKQITNDTREVLYWNANLPNDKFETPRVSFYNNDDAKKFDVTIISFSDEGDILYYNQDLK